MNEKNLIEKANKEYEDCNLYLFKFIELQRKADKVN